MGGVYVSHDCILFTGLKLSSPFMPIKLVFWSIIRLDYFRTELTNHQLCSLGDIPAEHRRNGARLRYPKKVNTATAYRHGWVRMDMIKSGRCLFEQLSESITADRPRFFPTWRVLSSTSQGCRICRNEVGFFPGPRLVFGSWFLT